MASMMASAECAMNRKTMLTSTPVCAPSIGVWEHPDRNASAIKWRKWKQVEHGQHDIDDQCVLEILCDPWCRRFWQVIDKVKGERGENGERNVHGRPSRSYPDHVASWVAECSKVHRHRLGITEQKRRVQQQ